MALSLKEITDVHLSIDSGLAVLYPGQIVAGDEYKHLIDQLIEGVLSVGSGRVFKLVSGERWRTQEMRKGRFALRKLRSEAPDLENLGLPPWIKGKLLGKRSASIGGLVMVLGPTGAGKTTTFSAVIAGRLRMHGGFALTIEDPPEDLLDGRHGERGYCEQLDAVELGGYEQAMHTALRCFPARENAILGYGEVRHNSTAAHLLRVALDGHLVIFTAHAKSISTGIARLISMAESDGEANARELFNSSFYMAVHQCFDSRKDLVATGISIDQCSALPSFVSAGDYKKIDHEVESVNLKMTGR